jgi:hypothetical protein
MRAAVVTKQPFDGYQREAALREDRNPRLADRGALAKLDFSQET